MSHQTQGKRNNGISTILGTMEFYRRANLEESTKMLKHFKESGHKEIDTAAVYSMGESEKLLSEIVQIWKPENATSEKMVMATKINAWDYTTLGGVKNDFTSENIKKQTDDCLNRLKTENCEILYLHSPDHNANLSETLKTCDEMYKLGKFKQLGLSNYSAWQVSEIVNLCEQNGWVKPSVYQGMYSAITRQVEKELFPCLRYYGIRFYAFSPLGGGILTGKWKFDDLATTKNTEPTRFTGNDPHFGSFAAKMYQNRYWFTEHFEAIENLKGLLSEVYSDESVGMAEAAYRWIYHHSELKDNDAVIVGASSLAQLEKNLRFAEKGSLDERVVEFFEAWWKNTSHLCPVYHR